MNHQDIVERMLIPPETGVDLKTYDPDWLLTKDMESLPKDEAREQSRALLKESQQELTGAQELLYATGTHSVLIVLQARDAAGKDGTIKHVMSGVNPQGCEVHSFKQPTPKERDHDYLWRYHRVAPAKGRIGIFNRSYYEEVLVVRVHPSLLGNGDAAPDRAFWERRFEAINGLEHHLVRNNTLVLKFFLHISKGEQRKRLLDRLNDPSKHWKFSPDDLTARGFWQDYTSAYEDALSATSTKWAPWYVVPADHKWVARAAVAAITYRAIHALDLKFPDPTPATLGAIAEARATLERK